MPFIPDNQDTSPQDNQSSPTPIPPSPQDAITSLASAGGGAANAGTQAATNPIITKLSDPNTPPSQKQAINDAMKGEAQHQRGLLDKFLGGLDSTANFFDKTLHMGDIANAVGGTAGRIAGDFGGTAVENISKFTKHPIDYGFEKDLNQSTATPADVAKTWGSLALEMWPGGVEGKSIAKEAATEIAGKVPLIGEAASKVVGGAFDVASKIAKPFKEAGAKAVSSITSQLPKVAEFFTNVAAKNFQFIKDNPEIFAQVKNFAEDETAIPSFGQRLFDLAKQLKGKASDEWQNTEASILKSAEGKLKPGLEALQNAVADKFSKEKIISGAEGALDYTKSAFSQNSTAQSVLDRLYSIIKAPAETVDELMTKRSEITDLVGEVPKTARNLKRIIGGVVDSFDTALNTITDGKAELMRNAYKAKVNPAYQIIDKMTDSNGKFSMDRATQYVKSLMAEGKFDSKQVVEDLQKQLTDAGISTSDLTKEAQGLSAARATDKLAPPTGSRVKDVVFTYGIGKVPVLSALVSPKFWAEAIEKTGAKASLPTIRKTIGFLKDDITKLIMQKVVTASIDHALNNSDTSNNDTPIADSTYSNTPAPDFVPDENQNDTTNQNYGQDQSIIDQQ